MTAADDRAEHKRRWAATSFAERREIMRAVNRGRVLDNRKAALLAVGQARHQQRFWRMAWVLGPLVALIQIGRGWEAVLANAIFASLVLGAMSMFWYRRAVRAETLNQEVVERGGATKPKPRREEREPAPRREHIPRQRNPVPRHQEWSSDRPDPATSRKKLQRRKKRR